MDGLLSVSEARQSLLAAFSPVEASNVPLGQAVGRVLAEPIFAPIDLPSFANSTVDGFAVRSQDLMKAGLDRPVTLQVVEDIAAGEVPHHTLGMGQAARIMTGAQVPLGADSIVPVEDTNFNHRQPGISAPPQVSVFKRVKPGENIRPRGQDITSKQAVLPVGNWLGPQEVALLAMLGIAEVLVFRRPRVAFLSTGDELLSLGSPLQPGKIYDSNSFLLSGLVAQYGGEPFGLGIAADREDAVESGLDLAIQSQADLILSSAGVSVGAFDYVRAVVEKNGRLSFWRVNMRPGKPLAFGFYRNIPFIGLPGNPVSAFVGFEVFVRPALLKLAGFKVKEYPYLVVQLAEPLESDGRESYLRGIVEIQNGRMVARLTGHQGSGNLFSLVQANALLILPAGVKMLPAGSEVKAWMLDRFSPGL